MHYSKFRIRNFKGIRDTTVDFDNQARASVFAFVGLNESGKTTILEAIHSFSPDKATSELVGGDESTGVPFKDRVPRHLISNFTGNVSVEATVSLDYEDKLSITRLLKNSHGIQIDVEALPQEILFDRFQTFEDGDYKNSFFTLKTIVQIKTGKQKKRGCPR